MNALVYSLATCSIAACLALVGGCGSASRDAAHDVMDDGSAASVSRSPSSTDSSEAAAQPGRPTSDDVQRVLSASFETESPSVHFSALSGEKDYSFGTDGGSGTLTAVFATRSPTGDGKGQVIFFWHGKDFVGVSAPPEALSIRDIRRKEGGGFLVTYNAYSDADALCCPSLQPVDISYQWSGTAMTPSAPLPESVTRGPTDVTVPPR